MSNEVVSPGPESMGQTPLADAQTRPKLLAISFSYPPQTEPRAIQVSRLLKRLHASTVLVCEGGSKKANSNGTLGDAESFLERILRVTFPQPAWRDFSMRVSTRLHLPVWFRTPDYLDPWKKAVLNEVEDLLRREAYRPDILVTFAFPLIDHIIGLELKKRLRVPWLAHFSDPWVDSPFKTFDPLTRALNERLERRVIEEADRIVFTSRETADLVMKKYDDRLRAKVRIVPHAFEPDLFRRAAPRADSRLVVRHLGELYLSRTPRPLFQALIALTKTEPELVEKFCFELIGEIHELDLNQLGLKELPEGLVVLLPRIGYRESLALMSSASGLMVIDAPVAKNAKSVFLPSKLIEYVGAARPIVGFTPAGTAADLIRRLGGWVADPSNQDESASILQQYLTFLWQHRNESSGSWGREEVRDEFEAGNVARKFEEVLIELSNG